MKPSGLKLEVKPAGPGGAAAGTERDPVCGMQVVPERAAGRYDYQGKTYYFCCQDCPTEFAKNPQKYVKGG